MSRLTTRMTALETERREITAGARKPMNAAGGCVTCGKKHWLTFIRMYDWHDEAVWVNVCRCQRCGCGPWLEALADFGRQVDDEPATPAPIARTLPASEPEPPAVEDDWGMPEPPKPVPRPAVQPVAEPAPAPEEWGRQPFRLGRPSGHRWDDR